MTKPIIDRLTASCISMSLRYPKYIYTIVLIITLALLSQMPKINIDTDPENMLSEQSSARIYHNSIKQQFNLYDSIVLGIVNPDGIYNPDSLSLVKQLSDHVMSLEQVVHSEVIATNLVDNITNLEHGAISFNWLMESAPKNNAGAIEIQRAIERLPLLNNTLASGDGKAMAIYVPLSDKNDSYAVAQSLRQFIATLPQDHQYYISGLPVAENQFGHEMFVQMAISAPLAGLMIFAMLWLFLRQSVVVVSAMLVAIASVIITMGSLIALGYSVHILSSMIAIFLMPIAVVDAIHVLSEYKEKLQYNHQHKIKQSSHQVISETISSLFQPMLFTTITSAVGFLSLTLTPIPPVKIFGAFVAIGIIVAFILTMTLLPAYLSRLSDDVIAKLSQVDEQKTDRLNQFIKRIGLNAVRQPKSVITLIASLTVIGALGIFSITINDNPVRWFKSDHQISIADKALNSHFAGTYNAYLVLEQTPTDSAALINNTLAQAQKLAITLPLPANATRTQLVNALDDFSFSNQLTARQQQFVDQAISGLQTTDNFYQPQQLDYIDKLSKFLRSQPQVGKVNGLTDVIKTVNRDLISGTEPDYRLPSSAQGVSQVLLQYLSSHRPNDLQRFVTPNKLKTLLWLQLTSGDNKAMSSVIEATEQFILNNPLPSGVSVNWAGKAYINVIWQQEMVNGMLDSLASAFVFVLIMMIALFRSVRYGLLAMLPLSITITVIYGLIGWMGKDYDMPIAVLSSLTLGLSVDFAIHFIDRYRALLNQGICAHQALKEMFGMPALAISRNALVIALGFTPLLFAPLVPYITVGLFLASIMLISALVTLTLIPAIVTIAQPNSSESL